MFRMTKEKWTKTKKKTFFFNILNNPYIINLRIPINKHTLSYINIILFKIFSKFHITLEMLLHVY